MQNSTITTVLTVRGEKTFINPSLAILNLGGSVATETARAEAAEAALSAQSLIFALILG